MSSESSSSAAQRLSSGDVPVAIRMYARSLEAALDVATLESHGIPAQIMGDNVGDTLNWYGLAVQKVELVVPRLKAAEAQKILSEQAAQHSQNQRTDWVCSGCGEVNGSEFDSCWSCGKIWSMELDQEHVAENLAQPLPPVNDAVYVLPDQDESPFAPPIAGTVVVAASSDEVEMEIRRAFRSMILSLCFPPLAFYTFYLGVQTLSKIASGELSASSTQCWRLRWIMAATFAIAPITLLVCQLIL